MSTMDEEQLRAYANLFHFRQAIGPRAEYYLEQFAKFERAGGRWVVTWNWPAFFFSCAWFAYRRMGGRSLLNFFLPILFIVMSHVLVGSDLQLLVMAGYLALAFVVIPMYANTLYYRNLNSLGVVDDGLGVFAAVNAKFLRFMVCRQPLVVFVELLD